MHNDHRIDLRIPERLQGRWRWADHDPLGRMHRCGPARRHLAEVSALCGPRGRQAAGMIRVPLPRWTRLSERRGPDKEKESKDSDPHPTPPRSPIQAAQSRSKEE